MVEMNKVSQISGNTWFHKNPRAPEYMLVDRLLRTNLDLSV